MKHSKIVLIAILVLVMIVSGTAYAQSEDDMFTVGLWSLFSPDLFIAAMAELGYVEGENITYMYTTDGLDDMETAQALIDADVDMLVTITDSSALSLMELTSDIPIVFVLSDDPIETGAVDSLISPGRNATGIVTSRPHERRFQLLKEINTATDSVYYLYPPDSEEYLTIFELIREIADDQGIEVEAVPVTDVENGLDMLQNVPEDVDWFFLTPFVTREPAFREALSTTAAARHIGISEVINTPEPGILMGFGPDIVEATRQAASVTDRILRGADPADLPVQPAENYLTINLEAAAAIDLTIPRGLLRQADLIVRPGDFEEVSNAEEASS